MKHSIKSISVLLVIILISSGIQSKYAAASIIGSKGCNYKINSQSLPHKGTYKYYFAKSCPSVAKTPIKSAMSTWNSVSSITLKVDSSSENDLPTMFGVSTYKNHSYYVYTFLRSLSSGDKAGIKKVESLL